MSRLTLRGLIERPTPEEWATERRFSSPLGSWVARFHDPLEFHMGADGWRLALIEKGRNVTSRHREITAMQKTKGFHLPLQYRPWCSSLPLIALYAWDNVLHLYDVVGQRCTERPIQFPTGIQWAPKEDRLVVTHESGVTILDPRARGFDVPIHHPRYECPRVFWCPDGDSFFVVNRTSMTTKTKLSFHEAAHGSLLDSEDFDPSDLVPYDDVAYRRIPRAGYSLHIGPGTRSLGCLLDTWSRVEFDLETQLLRAFVYRPVGPCSETDGQLTCHAEERGVEVALNA